MVREFARKEVAPVAREMLPSIGRIIARPFEGESGAYLRTANRKDYAMPPAPGMLLDQLAAHKITVHSVGKIFDVFLGRGIQLYDKTKTNLDGMAKTLSAMADTKSGLIYVNLVDFDMLFGHRNDVEGYARSLEECDAWVPRLLAALAPGDLVIFTADHGCDPTTPSTDHSREYTPLLVYGGSSAALGTRATLADIGQTVAENFGVHIAQGTSFLHSL